MTGVAAGGSRSIARMPRRNGYCSRIHAIDELLAVPVVRRRPAAGRAGSSAAARAEARRAEPTRGIEHRVAPARVVPVRQRRGIARGRQIQPETRFGEMLGEEEPPRGVRVRGERAHGVGAQATRSRPAAHRARDGP